MPLGRGSVQRGDFLFAVYLGNVAHQGKAVIVHVFIAKALLAKDAHLLKGQLLVGEHQGAEHHVAIGIPAVVPGSRSPVLGRALGQPHGHHRTHHWIGSHRIWVADANVLAVFLPLVAKVLQVERGDALDAFVRRTERNDVGKFVGYYVAKPVRAAAQVKVVVQRRGPNLNGVLIEKSRAIGVVVVVLEHNSHPPVGRVPIQLGKGRVRGFGNARRPRRSPGQPLVVEHSEVLGLHHLPR